MRTFLTLFLSFVLTSIIYAQIQINTNLPAFIYQGRPMPDWVLGSIPKSYNSTYYYKVFDAADSIPDEARRKVIIKAYQHAISAWGSDIKIQQSGFDAQVYITCEFNKKTPDGTKTVYWILFQIASPGIKNPQFNTNFTDCRTCDRWFNEKMEYERMNKSRRTHRRIYKM